MKAIFLVVFLIAATFAFENGWTIPADWQLRVILKNQKNRNFETLIFY